MISHHVNMVADMLLLLIIFGGLFLFDRLHDMDRRGKVYAGGTGVNALKSRCILSMICCGRADWIT